MKGNGDTLQAVRKNLGLTKNAASEKAGCTPKTYAKYERDGMDDTSFVEMCRKLGANVSDERTVTIEVEGHDPIELITTLKLGTFD